MWAFVARLSQSPPWLLKQQVKRLIGVSIVEPPGFRQVCPLAPDRKADHQIVERRHDMSQGGRGGAARIFMERDIAAIMQAGLNPPMSPIQPE